MTTDNVFRWNELFGVEDDVEPEPTSGGNGHSGYACVDLQYSLDLRPHNSDALSSTESSLTGTTDGTGT
jgi:hypothetical protein